MNAAQALVQSLVLHGVDRVFCVPGESFLAVLDALHDVPQVQVITCRHEGGAGLMAVADAKLTRSPGVAFVSRGPGATNASIALHVAQQDALPFVLFIGQIERKDKGRGAFQEVDYEKVLGGMCKAVWEVREGASLAAVCAQAFHAAASGVPGPVIVALPEDMLLDEAPPPAAPLLLAAPPAPAHDAVAHVAQALQSASRPIIIVGSAMAQADVPRLVQLSERFGVPVATDWKQQHLFPNRHAHYAGHLGYNIPAQHLQTLAPADLVLAIGTRLGDITTQGYRFPLAPVPQQPLYHVHPATEALGGVYQPTLALQADCAAFLRALLAHAPGNASPSPARQDWIATTHGYVTNLMQWRDVQATDGVVFGAVLAALDRLLPPDAILTQDAGNFSGWLHRYFHCDGQHTLLAAEAGAMGFGVPAAVAASLRASRRKVVCFVGDGGALMTGNELATALQYGAKPLIIVSNNGAYGTIRQHQELHYPGRVQSTALRNPDFTAWARAFGAHALRIDHVDQVESTLAQALQQDQLTVVEVRTSLRHISAFKTLAE
jgi:acetolactate synthase I/II/III large subunit